MNHNVPLQKYIPLARALDTFDHPCQHHRHVSVIAVPVGDEPWPQRVPQRCRCRLVIRQHKDDAAIQKRVPKHHDPLQLFATIHVEHSAEKFRERLFEPLQQLIDGPTYFNLTFREIHLDDPQQSLG